MCMHTGLCKLKWIQYSQSVVSPSTWVFFSFFFSSSQESQCSHDHEMWNVLFKKQQLLCFMASKSVSLGIQHMRCSTEQSLWVSASAWSTQILACHLGQVRKALPFFPPVSKRGLLLLVFFFRMLASLDHWDGGLWEVVIQLLSRWACHRPAILEVWEKDLRRCNGDIVALCIWTLLFSLNQ